MQHQKRGTRKKGEIERRRKTGKKKIHAGTCKRSRGERKGWRHHA
jgi:hypothetical protein